MTLPYKLSDMRNKDLQILPTIERAVEIYATKPEVTHQEVADLVGINFKTLMRIRRDPNFWAQVYDYYMATFEGDVVDVLKAAVREAKAGNVQAQRLVLEHSGKLQKNINITIDSPFERWMKEVKGDVNVQDAEILDNIPELDGLPPRTADNSPFRAKEELNKLRITTNKTKTNKKRAEQRKESRKWIKRAKVVGVDQLPARRPTPGQKKAWEKEIIQKENQASKLLQEQAGNNKTPCKPKTQKQGSPKTPTPPSS